MVDLIIGVPGSGKTYFAVDRLYKLITAEPKKYKHIYTNINGLNYDKINEIANIKDYAKGFEFDDLNIHIQDEYNFFQSQKELKSRTLKKIPLKQDIKEEDTEVKEDDIVFDYDLTCKEKGIYAPYYDSLIIIDECHLYFEDRIDDPKIRFLSYHRHFNIDLILITQGKNLIHKKYLSFVETMYMALPASKRFWSKRFRYRQYASYQEYAQNIIGTISVSLSDKVSGLYNSGSNVLSKSVIKKLLFPVIALTFGVFLFYKFFIADRFAKPTVQPEKVQEQQQPTQTQPSPISKNQPPKEINADDTDNDKKPFFAVTCFKKSCNFKDIDYSFDESTMYKFINAFNCKVIIPDNSQDSFSVYVLRCDKDLTLVLDLYKKNTTSSKAVKNEDSSPSFNPMH